MASAQEAWRKRNPEKVKEWRRKHGKKYYASLSEDERKAQRLWKRYRLTLEAWRQMLLDQEYRCEICRTWIDETDAVVDHNHLTKEVRSLLCHHCNRALGLVKEDKKILENMIGYLSRP